MSVAARGTSARGGNKKEGTEALRRPGALRRGKKRGLVYEALTPCQEEFIGLVDFFGLKYLATTIPSGTQA